MMCPYMTESDGYRSYGGNIPGYAQGAHFPGDEPGDVCGKTGWKCWGMGHSRCPHFGHAYIDNILIENDWYGRESSVSLFGSSYVVSLDACGKPTGVKFRDGSRVSEDAAADICQLVSIINRLSVS